MSHSAHRKSGAPTFIAASASLSLSGLEQCGPPAAMEPNLLDASDWFPNPGDHHHALLSPEHEHFNINFGSGFPLHSASLNTPYTELPHPMNGIAQFDPTQPRLDDLSPISPLQATYPPYATPYPDSTASSNPSEEPLGGEPDEEKRKRNQAASARFRQKKKQREQQMLEQSREMQERTKKLETDVDNLRRENKFLKKLLVEKVDNMSVEDKAELVKTAGLLKEA